MSTKLYVGNLSFDITEQDLEQTFGVHGSVLEVVIVNDRDTGRPRGFGFVTMDTKEEAEAAISALNGINHKGRDITVNEARSREDAPRRPQHNDRRGRRQSRRY